jgi:hypothetical protein
MNRTRGRPPVRLIQLHGSQPAPEQGTDFTPVRLPAAKPPPRPLHPSPTKAGKGIRTLDIQLGKRGSQAVSVRESALRCSDQG